MFQNIQDILLSPLQRDYNDRIAYLNGIVASWNQHLFPPADAADQVAGPYFKLGKGDISYWAGIQNRKFQSFHPVVQQAVQGFNRIDGRMAHTADMLDNVVCCQIFRIDDAADVQTFNDIVKGQTIDLGNKLCF